MHISLNDELSKTLEIFSDNRKNSMSKTVRYSLELLFSLEGLDPVKDSALKSVIERKFVVPKNIPIKSLYVFLYLLSKNYSKESSREFWTETVYVSSIDKTHEEIFLEIQDEYKNYIKIHSPKDEPKNS